MHDVMIFAFAVGAAACLGVGFVLQQNAAQRAPMSDFLSLRLLLDLMRMPRWLAGIALMVCGMALGAVALSGGRGVAGGAPAGDEPAVRHGPLAVPDETAARPDGLGRTVAAG
ncbi:hypothetical protein GCM10020000_64220 [Streptomyces olivoverticillatus]